MSILTKWGFRMVRANRSRTITAILAVVGFFALITSASSLLTSILPDAKYYYHHSIAHLIGSLIYYGNPLDCLVVFLCVCMLVVTAAILLSSFSVTADECLLDYRILTAAGATALQVKATLLFRALALSVGGAVGGVALGLLAARLSLGAELFSANLPYLFLDAGFRLMLVSGLLLPPCMMALASALAFRRRARDKRPHEPKHSMFRRSFARRVFGAGGTLGGMSSRINRRYRAVFTASFALCLAALAVQNNTLQYLTEMRSIQPDYDLELNCSDYSGYDKDAVPGSEVLLDDILRENADRFDVEKAVSFSGMASYNIYFHLNGDPLTDPSRGSTHYSSNRIYFLDDASFAQLAQENGIDADEDGALYYDMVESDGRLVPRLEPRDVYPDVTLHCLPDDFVYAPDGAEKYRKASEWDRIFRREKIFYNPIMYTKDPAAFRRAADPASVTKSFRVLGVVQSLPFFIRWLPYEEYRIVLVFPERMYETFNELLTSVGIEPSSSKSYYLMMSDPAAGIEAFRKTVCDDSRIEVQDRSYVSSRSIPAKEDRADENAYVSLYITNLYEHRLQLEKLQALVPKLQFLLMLTAIWILFAGILNTAYMNRMTRRREKAILESVGMSRRQQTGMLLYESARYGLCSAALGWVIFAAVYWATRFPLNSVLGVAGLHEKTSRVTRDLYSADEVRVGFLEETARFCARTWWVFAVCAVLIFALLVIADRLIERRSKREELIRILKDDSQQ